VKRTANCFTFGAEYRSFSQ